MDNLDTMSWSANAGITCLACHRITEVHGHAVGNGDRHRVGGDGERDVDHVVFAALGGGPKAWEEGTDHYVLTTFAQYPELTRPFLSFNRHLLYASSLPVRERQIAILRVAWTRRARYMWASHMRLSLQLEKAFYFAPNGNNILSSVA